MLVLYREVLLGQLVWTYDVLCELLSNQDEQEKEAKRISQTVSASICCDKRVMTIYKCEVQNVKNMAALWGHSEQSQSSGHIRSNKRIIKAMVGHWLLHSLRDCSEGCKNRSFCSKASHIASSHRSQAYFDTHEMMQYREEALTVHFYTTAVRYRCTNEMQPAKIGQEGWKFVLNKILLPSQNCKMLILLEKQSKALPQGRTPLRHSLWLNNEKAAQWKACL